MEKINFRNNTAPYINDVNLNQMQDNIENAIETEKKEIYSTTETKTNKTWIDEKPIYRKVINIGNLPNSSSKTINHNISNLDKFIDIRGMAVREIDKDTFIIPYVTFNSNNNGGIITYANETSIYVTTSSDRSAYFGTFILEYTKTTD